MNYRIFYFLLFVNSALISASNQQNYYEILSVAKTATTTEIIKAYRKLAMEFHPDRNKSDAAEEKMKQINAAHEILTDNTKRQNYDNNQSPKFYRNNSDVHYEVSFHTTQGQSSKEFKEKSKAWEREHECSL